MKSVLKYDFITMLSLYFKPSQGTELTNMLNPNTAHLMHPITCLDPWILSCSRCFIFIRAHKRKKKLHYLSSRKIVMLSKGKHAEQNAYAFIGPQRPREVNLRHL